MRQNQPQPQNLFSTALRLHQAGRLNKAEKIYREILARDPRNPDGLHYLGVVLHQLRRDPAAAELISRAIALNPNLATWHSNLGNVHNDHERVDQAIACYQRAIQIRPDLADAYSNLAAALKKKDRIDEAAACSLRALELAPDLPEAHNNFGTALQRQRRLREAADRFRHAISLRPDYVDAHTNLSTTLLTLGELEEGWQEYEWRWKSPQMFPDRRNFARPQWLGEEASGRTLLIYAEQGFGDTIQFCRYATLAAERGLRVVMEVPPALVRLLRNLPGVERVVAKGEPLPPFDLYSPMLTLPLALGTTVETIPCAGAYLRPDATQVATWRVRLDAIGGGAPKIGLLWAGGSRLHSPEAAAIDRRRSIAPHLLAPLMAVSGADFISLQKEGPPAPEDFRLADFMSEMTDFADTAALIANLDLVVSVDTAVAHLAAAVGKPVWLLDRFDACWRWLTDRRDSPWYPGLRLYRQPQPGQWEPVVAELARDLRDFLGTKAA